MLLSRPPPLAGDDDEENSLRRSSRGSFGLALRIRPQDLNTVEEIVGIQKELRAMMQAREGDAKAIIRGVKASEPAVYACLFSFRASWWSLTSTLSDVPASCRLDGGGRREASGGG